MSFSFRILFFVCMCSLISQTQAAEPMTWPHPLGPEYNRVSRERNLSLDWDDESLVNAGQNDEMWSITELAGLQSPLIFNEKLYAQFDYGNSSETTNTSLRFGIICWSVEDRDPEARFNQQISSDLPQRLTHSHLVGDPSWRQLFFFNVTGEVVALDSDLGNTLWTQSLFETSTPADLQAQSVPPVIFEHLLITTWLTRQENQNTFHCLALDRRNGMICWQLKRSLRSPTLADPLPAVFQNQVVLAILGEQGGIELLQIRTGKSVQKLQPSDNSHDIRELLYQDGQLLALTSSSGKETQKEWTLNLWRLSGSGNQKEQTPVITPEAIANWKLQPAERATALLHDDAVFAANSAGTLEVFSAKQNKRLHELPTAQGTTPHLQWVDEQLLLTTDSGLWQAYQCKNSACELIFAKEFGKEIPFLPAIVKKQIYIQHPDELTAFGPFDNDDAISDMMIPLTKIAQENLSEKPGSIQLIPARVSLSQGYKQHFQALLFNEHGEFLKTIDPQELTWNWKGPGTFSKEQGKLTLPQNPIEVSKSTLEVHYESFTAESIIKVETSLKDFTVPSAP